MNIEEYIDHTFLKPDTDIGDIEQLCKEAVVYHFNTVCVPPLFVKKAKMLTADTGIKISTVTGYPFGFSAIEAKVAETVLAVIDGADDIEMVVNTGAIKNNDWQFLAHEINTVMPIIRGKGKKITMILETGLLTGKEIITACDIYGAAGVDFVKAGTGYVEDKAAAEHTGLIRRHLAAAVQLKTGVAIHNYPFALFLINAGADRLCCGNGIKLKQETIQQN
jgi:deoxyribose-phosphate aldolase